MKKICHITTVHPAFDTRIFYKEAKTLARAGYNVVLIARHNENEIVDGVKIIDLPKPKNRFQRMFFLTKRAYKLALKEKADIYHFHDPELLPWMVKLKKKTRAKVIYDVHEDYPKQILSKHWIPKIFRSIIANIFDIYEKKAIKNFDFIITVGEDVKEKFKKLNPNVETIKNYPNLDYFKNISANLFSKSVFTLIYTGGLTRERGIKEIVKALEFLPENVELILLGEFVPSDFEKEIRKMEGFKKVKYFGQVPFKEVPKYLAKADIGIVCFLPLPNNINSNPNKLFEYMLVGLPVIASNFPLWKEIIEGNKCGICVDPLNPIEIAKAIHYLIEHPEEAKKMGENGKKAVLEKYNWESESKKLLKIYEELLR